MLGSFHDSTKTGTTLAPLPVPDRLLVAFSMPVLAAVTSQAFLSRAHANWAAVAYVAATVLVIAHLLRSEHKSWLRASFAFNAVVAVAVAVSAAFAGQINIPGLGDPFGRLMGNRALAAGVTGVLDEARRHDRPFAAILSDERELTASLIYYGRHQSTPVVAWQSGARPRDHFEMTRNFEGSQPAPVLLVSKQRLPAMVTRHFRGAEPLPDLQISLGAVPGAARTFHLFKLWDYRGRP